MYVVTEPIRDIHQRPDNSNRSSKAGSHGGGRYGVGMDVCGYQRHPRDCSKQVEEAPYYTRKWRATANVKKCAVRSAVVVCNENEMNPVNFSWKWREDGLPILYQYTLARTLTYRSQKTTLGVHTWQQYSGTVKHA